MKIWTRYCNPFVMGGSCYQDIAIEVPECEFVLLGKGFYGALITDPIGQTHVVERMSGALIGTTLEEVMNDILDCDDVEIMEKQVQDGIERCKNAKIVDAKIFWNMK